MCKISESKASERLWNLTFENGVDFVLSALFFGSIKTKPILITHIDKEKMFKIFCHFLVSLVIRLHVSIVKLTVQMLYLSYFNGDLVRWRFIFHLSWLSAMSRHVVLVGWFQSQFLISLPVRQKKNMWMRAALWEFSYICHVGWVVMRGVVEIGTGCRGFQK